MDSNGATTSFDVNHSESIRSPEISNLLTSPPSVCGERQVPVDCAGVVRGWKNQLFYGDNLDVLRSVKIPTSSIDLCYIDPPFNSQRTYNQIYNNVGSEDQAQAQAFVDTWLWDDRAIAGYNEIIDNAQGRFQPRMVELIRGLNNVLQEGSLLAYLVSMSLRMTEIHRLLKPTGCFYMHCDPTSGHYLKLLLDAIFCTQGGEFLNEIVWRRTRAHNDRKLKKFGAIHDTIFFYSKSDQWDFTVQFSKRDANAPKTHDLYRHTDGILYRKGDCRAPGNRGPLYEWNGHKFNWRFSPQEKDRLIAEGKIVYSKNGMPRVLREVDPHRGSPLQDIWTDIDPPNSGSDEALGYQTQKPEGLLERIIEASTKEGDTILDAYCGCGTSVAVAQGKRRKWVGIDITYQSISLVIRRLEDTYGKDVLDTIATDGIPRDIKSAIALAHKDDDRLRKEFEKWAVLTYTNNRAVINEKKGADAGVDGRAYFKIGKNDNAKIIFQVKSGSVGRGDVAKLRGDMAREKASLAVLLTLEKASRPMLDEAKAAGKFRHEDMGRDYDAISIVPVSDIIEGKRLEIPMSLEVLKAAQRVEASQQIDWLLDEPVMSKKAPAPSVKRGGRRGRRTA
jgi:DNA modification methylase